MTTLIEEKTVGEIAAERTGSARVFEKYGIDYCCGGKLPLTEACSKKGVAAEQVMAEIEAAGATRETERDWQTVELDELIDHILTTHHAYLKAELPRLALMVEKVRRVHGAHHGDSLVPLSETFEGLKAELESHMMKEEMILFPMIRAGRRGVSNPIAVMEHEHDSAGRALERMRAVTGDYTLPEGACGTYRATFEGLRELEADLHRHIHLENNILFVRAAAV
jgi:regulator of cell morphogenesis and NO signaling